MTFPSQAEEPCPAPSRAKAGEREVSALETAQEKSERLGRQRRVERRLKGLTVCRQCNCTLETYADRCSASLDVACEGFRMIEEARKP